MNKVQCKLEDRRLPCGIYQVTASDCTVRRLSSGDGAEFVTKFLEVLRRLHHLAADGLRGVGVLVDYFAFVPCAEAILNGYC